MLLGCRHTMVDGPRLEDLDRRDGVVARRDVKSSNRANAEEEPRGVFVEIPELHRRAQEKPRSNVEFERTVDSTGCDPGGPEPEK